MLRGCVLLFLALLALSVRAQSLVLTLDAVDHPLFAASGLRLTLASLAGGAAEIHIDRLRFAGQTLEKLRLRCEDLRWSPERIECPRGEVQVPGSAERLPLRFAYAPRSQSLDLVLEPAAGERWQLLMSRASGVRTLEAVLDKARIERIAPWLPPLADFKPAAVLNGRLNWSEGGGRERVAADLHAGGLSFSDAAGSHAGEKIAAKIAVRGEERDGGWNWQADVALDQGDIFWQPFFFGQGGHRLALTGMASEATFVVSRGELELAGVGRLAFSGEWDRIGKAMRKAQFETGTIDLTQAAAVFLAPLLEQSTLPKFGFSGKVRLAGAIDEGGLSRLDLNLSGAAAEEAGGRYALRGVDAEIPWRRDESSAADIRVAGGSLGRIPLGGFALPVKMRGLSFELSRAEIPFLDGRLILEELRAAKREGGEWQWQLGGALHPVSMALLTETLGLPRMSGTMSASIPKISHARSTVEMDGALIIQVFDGYVSATNLKLIEPFGRVPRLYADLEMRHFDLGQLTETFSFGSITGFIDGDVKGLELARWRPQRFEARLLSSPGDYRKRISQRAVQNISSLGGAGAGAAIQRSFLRFFDQFGYDKMGLSCVLADGVCRMGGVEAAPNGYVIVKGGGIPAISVIGYNRQVNWDELVSRIHRATVSNVKPIIE